MRSLHTIQVLAKIGKVISTVLFILCIVGACLSLAGVICLLSGFEAIEIGDVTLRSIIETNSDILMPALYGSLISGVVLCIAEAVISKYAEIYFKHELEAGDPFTFEGADELKHVGIMAIVVSLAAQILLSIGLAVASGYMKGINEISTGEFNSIGIGIILIVISVFFRYGAEIKENKPENE